MLAKEFDLSKSVGSLPGNATNSSMASFERRAVNATPPVTDVPAWNISAEDVDQSRKQLCYMSTAWDYADSIYLHI
jgi:hypothetical protein